MPKQSGEQSGDNARDDYCQCEPEQLAQRNAKQHLPFPARAAAR